MPTQYLRDYTNNIIGIIEIDKDGNKTLKGPDYAILGFYTVKGNITKTYNNTLVGYGDMLAILLKPMWS